MTIATPTNQTPLPYELSGLTVFDVTGSDATTFLQGQLTQDVTKWRPNEIKRAAWCNPKGRMLVTFYLWQIESGFRLLLACDLAPKVLPRLKMFVMRSKVSVSDPLATPLFACMSQHPALSHDGQAFTLLNNYAVAFNNDAPTPSLDWTSAHTLAGVAWVSAANSEQFVPQTANFELVGGVDFRKGCYPGQEVIARSQYLGKLKLRAAIASSSVQAIALQDVFEAGSINPIGRVIQAGNGIILFEAPHTLIESGGQLHLGSPNGPTLQVHTLPYPVIDITA